MGISTKSGRSGTRPDHHWDRVEMGPRLGSDGSAFVAADANMDPTPEGFRYDQIALHATDWLAAYSFIN
jgi:hypothetical protein